jgi:hypothetical protein
MWELVFLIQKLTALETCRREDRLAGSKNHHRKHSKGGSEKLSDPGTELELEVNEFWASSKFCIPC